MIDTKLDSVKEKMKKKFRAMETQLDNYQQQTGLELARIQNTLLTSQIEHASLKEELRAMESQLEEYKQQTTSELAGLQSNMTAGLVGLHTSLQYNTERVNMLRDDTSSLKGDLSSLNDSMNKISDNVEAHDNHVTTKLMECDQNLQQNFSLQLNNSVYQCGGTGGWRRVVNQNFTDPNTPCPSGWWLTSYSKRICGRVSPRSLTCDSVTFPVSEGNYTRVCGRIIAYQDKFTSAFRSYNDGIGTTIDSAYDSGISLTRGSPRQHIWTFAAGYRENYRYSDNGFCPCDTTTITITIPPFVGGDYFCESGRHPGDPYGLYSDDPLWDGDGCTASSTCCSFNNPPYFTKEFPSPTTDDIEVRLCHLYSNDDTPIEFIELYVQ